MLLEQTRGPGIGIGGASEPSPAADEEFLLKFFPLYEFEIAQLGLERSQGQEVS